MSKSKVVAHNLVGLLGVLGLITLVLVILNAAGVVITAATVWMGVKVVAVVIGLILCIIAMDWAWGGN